MYSVCHNGRVMDFKYKSFEYGYNFYITDYPDDDIFIGQIFRIPRYWTAVSFKECPGPKLVNGFRSRHDAAIYMLVHQEYLSDSNQIYKDVFRSVTF